MDIKELDQKYIANTYLRFPLQLEEGKGALLRDEKGKTYIDLGSGIAVNIFGAADEKWLAAITAQAGKLAHTSNLYFTEPCVDLAQMLCEKTGMKKVFFSNSGAEANECAIKAARLYALQKKGEGHHTIITLKNSFHGRSLATLAATGQDDYHTDFGPFPEGFVYADPASPDDLFRLAEENNCAAIMMELIQGEGGVQELSQEFVAAAVKIAKEKDLLLICDEVQSGNGRSGKLYAYMHYGFTPDILTTAKGLGGGLPIGVTLFSEKTAAVYTPGKHGSTFGGNPVCCAGALSILSRLDQTLLDEVTKKSAYIRQELSGAKGVKKINGLGLMLGVETERPVDDVIADCMEKGVLVLPAHGKLRLLPPLNIREEDLAAAIQLLKEVLAK